MTKYQTKKVVKLYKRTSFVSRLKNFFSLEERFPKLINSLKNCKFF